MQVKYIFLLVLVIGLAAEVSAQDSSMAAEEMYMELAEPGEEHNKLASLAGEWEQVYHYQPEPGGEFREAKGTSVSKMILGNRFLEMDAEGEMMGQQVKSKQIMGFDKRFGVYTLDGYDTMGTYAIHAEGKYDSETKTIVFEGENYEPMMNGYMDYVINFKIIDENNTKSEIIFITPEGNEMKILEVVSTRK